MPKTCYFCGAIATSKEHSPARCFFPDDASYRKNLISVPSCQIHNENTSKDDEYVRNLIVMSLDNNQVAFHQFVQKTVKSFTESTGLLKITTQNKVGLVVNNQNTYAFQIDRDRFDKVMRKISYSLFFKTYNAVWQRELIVMTKNLYNADMEIDQLGKIVVELEHYLPSDSYQGDNPTVFNYAFGETESLDPNDKYLRLVFYEGFYIWVISKSSTSLPSL